ncbi:amino acid permease [Sutcliffiella horikoshii]|uniref:Amino acid permease n=1 Tax=Sutcliffiella horikoshii TaxID=79883 RepID=A0A5D4SWY3_9BACI|nr:amino acid permease [Sutcliffiella horikoshii]TYS67815.1 amino acid permease [Sutcliffiella horikoshii]
MSKSSCSPKQTTGDLAWWQLSLIGIGCTIGIGFFLGSSLGIKLAGASIILSFLIGAAGTYIVYSRLAKMTIQDPQEGSFCYYAGQAFGKWASFSCGWNYWCSNILIMGSQLTALGLLSQFWFPDIPLWIFSAGYAILSFLIVMLGTKGFDKMEDLFAIIKVAAIVMFIVIALGIYFGWIKGDGGGVGASPGNLPNTLKEWMPMGVKGVWSSLIYAFYAYGGIEVIGLMAMQLKKKEDTLKAGTIMMFLLMILYVGSLSLAVSLAAFEKFNEKESPFVTALTNFDLDFFPHVFNGAIIIAGFSTMTAALFGVTTLLVTLAKDGDAPKLFQKKIQFRELPLPSLLLGVVGLAASVVCAFVLLGKVFEYITTAAGLLLLYNWIFILLSSFKLEKNGKLLSVLGLLLLLLAISGTLAEKTVRNGFFISILFVALIGIITLIMQRKWKKGGRKKLKYS